MSRARSAARRAARERRHAWFTLTLAHPMEKLDVQAPSLEAAEGEGMVRYPKRFVYAMRRPLSRGGNIS
jgi:hypothetical protein